MSRRSPSNIPNQTDFVDQAVLLKEEGQQQTTPLEEFNKVKKSKKMWPFYALAAVIVFLAIVASMLILSRHGSEGDAAQEEEVVEVESLDPLTQRVNTLKLELEEADPTRQSLPFPQVDLEFNIN